MADRRSIFGSPVGRIAARPQRQLVEAVASTRVINGITQRIIVPGESVPPQPNPPEDPSTTGGGRGFTSLPRELRHGIFRFADTRHIVRVTADPALQPVGLPLRDGSYRSTQTRVFAVPQHDGWVHLTHDTRFVALRNRPRIFAAQAPSTYGVPFDLTRDILHMVDQDALTAFTGGMDARRRRGYRQLVQRHAGLRYIAVGTEAYALGMSITDIMATMHDLDTIYLEEPALTPQDEVEQSRARADFFDIRRNNNSSIEQIEHHIRRGIRDRVRRFQTQRERPGGGRAPNVVFLNPEQWDAIIENPNLNQTPFNTDSPRREWEDTDQSNGERSSSEKPVGNGPPAEGNQSAENPVLNNERLYKPNTESNKDNLEEAAQSPPGPLQSFTLFPRLAPELQQMIWRRAAAIGIPRVITIAPTTWPSPPSLTARASPVVPITTLHVNREARAAARRQIARFSDNFGQWPASYMNFKGDTLLFADVSTVLVAVKSWDLGNIPREDLDALVRRHAGVRFLALGGQTRGMAEEWVATFYDLQVLYIEQPIVPASTPLNRRRSELQQRRNDAIAHLRQRHIMVQETIGKREGGVRFPQILFLGPSEWRARFQSPQARQSTYSTSPPG